MTSIVSQDLDGLLSVFLQLSHQSGRPIELLNVSQVLMKGDLKDLPIQVYVRGVEQVNLKFGFRFWTLERGSWSQVDHGGNRC